MLSDELDTEKGNQMCHPSHLCSLIRLCSGSCWSCLSLCGSNWCFKGCQELRRFTGKRSVEQTLNHKQHSDHTRTISYKDDCQDDDELTCRIWRKINHLSPLIMFTAHISRLVEYCTLFSNTALTYWRQRCRTHCGDVCAGAGVRRGWVRPGLEDAGDSGGDWGLWCHSHTLPVLCCLGPLLLQLNPGSTTDSEAHC